MIEEPSEPMAMELHEIRKVIMWEACWDIGGKSKPTKEIIEEPQLKFKMCLGENKVLNYNEKLEKTDWCLRKKNFAPKYSFVFFWKRFYFGFEPNIEDWVDL